MLSTKWFYAAFFSINILLFSSCGSSENKVEFTDSVGAAINSLEKKVKERPDSLNLRSELADAYESGGNTGKAIDIYDSLLVTDSLNTLWYNRKGSLYLSMGDTASALSSLEASMAIDPSQADILLEMGFIYADLKNDSALMIGNFLQRASKDPGVVTNALYLKGIYFSNKSETEKAIAVFDSCIVSDYTFIDAYLEKGIMLYNHQKYNDALAVFEKARSVQSSNADAYFWTGKVYEALNKKAEAIDYYKKTLGLDDKITEAAERLKKLQ